MAGHSGDGVVQDDDRGVGLVVGHVDEARDPGVDEGGISDDRHGLALSLSAAGLVEAVEAGDGGAHADGGVDGAEGRHGPQGVAADVPQDRQLVLRQGVEQSPVGAAGAHHRRPGGDGLLQLGSHGGGLTQLGRHQILVELVNGGEHVLACGGQAQGAAVGLNEAVQLLHHRQGVHRGGEVQDQLLRQGPDHAQLQHRISVHADLLHVLVGGGGGDDAQLVVSALLHPVHRGGLRPLHQAAGALLHHRVAALGVAGHHDVLGPVLLVGLLGNVRPLPGVHHGLGVADPGAHLQQHRRVELLGELIGQLGELQGLGGVAGLQHGELGGHGVVAGVLLVLGRVHPRVVGHADDHPGVDAGVGDGKQGVRRHVEPHVLHAAEAPLSRQGGAEGRFHGHLLVGGPLRVDLGVLGGGLGDLRAGGAGIAGDKGASRLVEPSGNGFVAQHQSFHVLLLALPAMIRQ